MKEIRGSASATVRASAQDSYALLAAVDRYAEWNGELVRELEVLQAEPLRLRAVICVKRGRLTKTFELRVATHTEPLHVVHITRIPNDPDDPEGLELSWRVAPAGSGARLELAFSAVASFVPGFLPLGGIGNLIAGTLLEAATDALGGRV
jgi:ribosome-associated toxin RatA of RatAB toxin-antitoxin module